MFEKEKWVRAGELKKDYTTWDEYEMLVLTTKCFIRNTWFQ